MLGFRTQTRNEGSRMHVASGTIPYAASFLVSALNGFDTCPSIINRR